MSSGTLKHSLSSAFCFRMIVRCWCILNTSCCDIRSIMAESTGFREKTSVTSGWVQSIIACNSRCLFSYISRHSAVLSLQYCTNVSRGFVRADIVSGQSRTKCISSCTKRGHKQIIILNYVLEHIIYLSIFHY